MNKGFVFFLLGIFIGLLAGIYLGMTVQQMVIIAGLVEVGESLEGSHIEVNVDLNETKLTEGFKEVFIHAFNQTIKNQSIQKENE